MEIVTLPATTKRPAVMFAGDVWFDVISPPQPAPREEHWHGATPDHFMSHLAMWEGVAEGPETTWGEHLIDGEHPTA